MGKTLEEIKDSIDNYDFTINTLLCFVSLATWPNHFNNPELFYSLGRRMDTSDKNPILRNKETITPDAIIQLSKEKGLIVEVKASLPDDETRWNRCSDQLIKYDDELKGWWTSNKRVTTSKVIFLIYQSLAVKFKNYFEIYLQNKEINNDDFVHIEFMKESRRKEFIFFRFSYNKLSEFNHIENIKKLEEGISIPINDVRNSYGSIKFYDGRPELEYLIAIIWQDSLNYRRSDTSFDKRKKCWPISVNVRDLTEELQKSFGSIQIRKSCNDNSIERNVEFPRINWVRGALKILVNIDLGEKIDEENYIIYFKRIQGEVIDYFFKKIRDRKTKIKKDLNEKDQLKLFGESKKSH